MNKVTAVYLRVIVLLFPLVYMPLVSDMFGMGKIWWWLVMALVGVVMWSVGLLAGKKEELRVNGGLWIMLLLALWSTASWFRLPVGVRERVMWSATGLASVWGLAAWYFLLLQLKDKSKLFAWVRGSALVVSLSALVTFVLPEKNLPIAWPKDNPLVVINQSWSLSGSLLGEVVLLAYVALTGARGLSEKLKKGENYLKEAVMTAFVGLGLFLDIYRITKLGWGVIDINSAWVIAVEAFKRSPLWGVGVGNFAEAFNQFRPNSYNLTPSWSSVANISAMNGLQLWTEMGVVGLALILLLARQILRVSEKGFKFVMAMAALIAWLVLPYSMMSWMVLILALVWALEAKEVKLMLPVGENKFNLMPWLVALMGVGAAGAGFWASGKNLMAEFYLRKSLVAASKNDGSMTYEMQRKAIAVNQNVADYRKLYSQTNLAIAQTLLANKEMSEDDKQKASVLLQQAVNEAKAAVALDNYNANYWTNLAVIYKAMVGVVDGAADWSVQAYQQAMLLDPANPLLKLEYGGILYAAEQYEAADRVFEQVVSAKADYANGWYNWAHTAKKMNKLYDAVQRMAQSVSLVPATSGDYEKAAKELEEWKKEYEEAVAKAQEAQKAAQVQAEEKKAETLKTADPLPTMGAEEKINVSEKDLEPPKVSPSP